MWPLEIVAEWCNLKWYFVVGMTIQECYESSGHVGSIGGSSQVNDVEAVGGSSQVNDMQKQRSRCYHAEIATCGVEIYSHTPASPAKTTQTSANPRRAGLGLSLVLPIQSLSL